MVPAGFPRFLRGDRRGQRRADRPPVRRDLAGSRAHGRPGGDRGCQATAGLAFVTFTNTLMVALLALIPGEHFGVAAVVVAVWSISLALSAQIFFYRRAQAPGWRWVVLSGTSLLVFGVQFGYGIAILATPGDQLAVTSIAVIGVVLSAIASPVPGSCWALRRWASSTTSGAGGAHGGRAQAPRSEAKASACPRRPG